MKRKTNKKSGIIAAVVGLSAVSLVSVGFASWVMTGNDSTTIDGTISVETVDDHRYFIMKEGAYAPAVDYGKTKKAGGEENASSICFGIDDSTPINNAWLVAGGTGDNAPKYENLTASVIFYVANLKDTDTAVPSASLAVVTNTTGWNAAVTATYVAAAPTTLTCTIDPDVTVLGDDGLTYRKVTASVEFAWGAYFTHQGAAVNPYVYFNNMQNTTANGNTAHTVLNALEQDLAGVTFRVTLATTAQ